MNPWGYELIGLDNPSESSSSSSSRGVYRAMLTEFTRMPNRIAEVRYGDRDVQAIYMGLRNAKKADAPLFDGVTIRKEGTNEKTGTVYLEK